jgi:hypothetical protein
VCEPDAGARGREEEDFTRDRSDFKDATIIAKKVTELRCYVPYQLEGHWCRLRHLGARRNDQLTAAGAARQGLRELLDCAWPTVLQAAADPLDALTSGRFRHLTTRTDNPLHHGPARAAIAAALCCASCSSSSPAGSPGTSPHHRRRHQHRHRGGGGAAGRMTRHWRRAGRARLSLG